MEINIITMTPSPPPPPSPAEAISCCQWLDILDPEEFVLISFNRSSL